MTKRKIILYIIVTAVTFIAAFGLLQNNKKQNQINDLEKQLEIQENVIETNKREIDEKVNQIEDLQISINKKQAEIDDLVDEMNRPKSVEELFAKASDTYDVDYNMLMGIARLETGNFTSSLWRNNNNPGGMRGNNGWMSFSTPENGIMYMAHLLRNNYLNQGLTDLESIGAVYCPDNPVEWANKVRSMM